MVRYFPVFSNIDRYNVYVTLNRMSCTVIHILVKQIFFLDNVSRPFVSFAILTNYKDQLTVANEHFRVCYVLLFMF
jgi:hypothetical protein